MSADRDVMIAEKITGTGFLAGGDPIDVIKVYALATSSRGQLVLTNGNGGDTQLDIDTPGNGGAIAVINFPNGIIPFPAGCDVGTFSNVTSATIFYRKRT